MGVNRRSVMAKWATIGTSGRETCTGRSRFSRSAFVLLLVTLLMWGLGWHHAHAATATDSAHTDATAASRLTPRILVLNSYHPFYQWTDNQVQGIIESLGKAGIPMQSLGIEYLDAKRIPDLSHEQAFIGFLTAKFHLERLECLVVTDNAALEFALNNRERLFSGVPIVFCGINGFTPDMVKGHQRVTGIAEVMDISGTLALALRLHPWARTLAVIHDQTVTGLTLRREFDEVWKQMKEPLQTRFLTDLTFEELGNELQGLSSDSIVLLLSFASDRLRNVIEQSDEARLLSASCRVPLYALHEQRLGHGIIGGNLLSGRFHGVRAGELAARILRGTPAETLPVINHGTGVPMFDAARLEHWGIAPQALPRDAVIVNLPRSIWNDYRPQVLTALVLFLALAGIIMALALSIAARRRVESSLRQSEARLSDTLTRLQHSEEKFRSIYEGAVEGIFQVSLGGRFLSANPALAGILGYAGPEELVSIIQDSGHQLWLRPEDRDEYIRLVSEQGRLSGYECRLKRKNGSPIWASLNSRLVSPGHETDSYVEGFLEDITRRKQAELERVSLERQLQQSQKMEAVGRLAGGIAHDFNNMLYVILGYCELILRKNRDLSCREEIAEIRKAAQRSADLTRQLLAFSRRQTITPKTLHLNAHLRNMEHLLRKLTGEDIDIRIDLQTDIWPIHADPSQIDQLVVNLVANARDSMTQGGNLVVMTRNRSLSEEDCRGRPEFRPGDYACLTITDTGCGMDRETLEHVFEPFFTTKPEGKGTGLGMATVYGIIQQNKGSIGISSQPGLGTTVEVFLPRTQLEESPLQETSAGPIEKGQGTVLLVEDQETVRKITALMLQELGYRVIVAESPEEALSICRSEEPIDLLLTDVIMPQMSGKTLASGASQLRPGIRIVFMSGHPSGVIANHGIVEQGVFLLSKPFSLGELSDRIREAMK